MAVTRRSVLALMAQVGGVALSLGTRVTRAATAPPPADGVTERLRRLLRDPSGARRLGQIYLQQAQEECDPAHLADLILSSLKLTPHECLRLERQELSILLAAGVRSDFAAARTASVNGWILSRTEARVCALWT